MDAVIADAAVKQIGSELMPEFLTAMIHGAETVSDDVRYGREGLADYLKLGYVPAEIDESVNKTLDYAYSDWLISVVAGTLNDTATQAKYATRSQNYRKLFDPAVGSCIPVCVTVSSRLTSIHWIGGAAIPKAAHGKIVSPYIKICLV